MKIIDGHPDEGELRNQFNTIVAAKLRNNKGMTREQAEREASEYLMKRAASQIQAVEEQPPEPVVETQAEPEPQPQPEQPTVAAPTASAPRRNYMGVRANGRDSRPYQPFWQYQGVEHRGRYYETKVEAAKVRDKKLVELRGLDEVRNILNFPEDYGLEPWSETNPRPGARAKLTRRPSGDCLEPGAVEQLLNEKAIEMRVIEALPSDSKLAVRVLKSILSGLGVVPC